MFAFYKSQLTFLSFLNRSPNPAASCKPNLTNPSYSPELQWCSKQPSQSDNFELHFMPWHKYLNTAPQCCTVRCGSLQSSSKCGCHSIHCTSINNTGSLSTIFFHFVQQSASEYPNPNTASGSQVRTVLAAGSGLKWLTPYCCN